MKNDYPPLHYHDYLRLDQLLTLQHARSQELSGNLAHDEILFIIVHQTYELWFKQILHELHSVRNIFKQSFVNEKNIGIAVSRLSRIIEIQKLLVDQIRVLETMTPLDFLDFRNFLLPASGFQSYQFRLLENTLGLRPQQRKQFDKTHYAAAMYEEHQETLRESECEKSLFNLIEGWLERTPFLDFQGFKFWEAYRSAVEQIFDDDRSTIAHNEALSDSERKNLLEEFAQNERSFLALFDKEQHDRLCEKGYRRLSHKATQAALLIQLYRDEPILHLPFRLLTSLIEIDELFTTWRYRHALMAQRMIGSKLGTGGSSGHQYLKVAADSHKIFTDLTNLSTYLIPRSKLPELPEEIQKNLGFYYSKES
jgi:tryptophan 2,3-dioxygenase